MSEADFRKIVELDLLRQKLYDDVTKDLPTTAEQVHARHILVAIRTPEPPAAPTPEGGPTPDPNAPTPAPTLEAARRCSSVGSHHRGPTEAGRR